MAETPRGEELDERLLFGVEGDDLDADRSSARSEQEDQEDEEERSKGEPRSNAAGTASGAQDAIDVPQGAFGD